MLRIGIIHEFSLKDGEVIETFTKTVKVVAKVFDFPDFNARKPLLIVATIA